MTRLTNRLFAAIRESTLPDKALVAAIQNAGKPPVVIEADANGLMPQDKVQTSRRRQYNRRDMKAE